MIRCRDKFHFNMVLQFVVQYYWYNDGYYTYVLKLPVVQQILQAWFVPNNHYVGRPGRANLSQSVHVHLQRYRPRLLNPAS